jgi:hypothetical protein
MAGLWHAANIRDRRIHDNQRDDASGCPERCKQQYNCDQQHDGSGRCEQ